MEQSIIDPANKTIETYIRNLSFPRIMLVEENQLYKLDNETQMLVESDVKVTSSLRFLTRRIEEYGLQRWKNAFEPVKKSPTLLHQSLTVQRAGLGLDGSLSKH